MLPSSVNIAISGLGISATTDLKNNIRNLLPDQISINWTNISDQDIECLFINEVFFEQQSIQNIILSKNIPFLKVTKNSDENNLENNLLCVPINNVNIFKQWINEKLLSADPALKIKKTLTSNQNQNLKDPSFFADLYESDFGKYHIMDSTGTLSVIDQRGHFAWVPTTRTASSSDESIQIAPASPDDFLQVSLKKQFNLEDWLFNLIWNSKDILELPDEDDCYKINYSVQPIQKDRKLILQLSASFILGAKISEVSQQLNIPIQYVQKFIAAHLAINNAEERLEKDCKFGKKEPISSDTPSLDAINSFFSKFKKRFGF